MKKSVTIINKNHSVGAFTFDSTYFEQHVADLEVTKQPVEFGAKIPDHAFVEPISLTISGGVSDNPLLPNPSFDNSAGSARSSNAYQQLLRAMNDRQLIVVQTGLINYRNMLIKNISTVQDAKTANIFNFIMTLEQILIVNVQNIDVPVQFLQPGKVSDLASPVKKNGTQTAQAPKNEQVSIYKTAIDSLKRKFGGL